LYILKQSIFSCFFKNLWFQFNATKCLKKVQYLLYILKIEITKFWKYTNLCCIFKICDFTFKNIQQNWTFFNILLRIFKRETINFEKTHHKLNKMLHKVQFCCAFSKIYGFTFKNMQQNVKKSSILLYIFKREITNFENIELFLTFCCIFLDWNHKFLKKHTTLCNILFNLCNILFNLWCVFQKFMVSI
jgi:hypothetical protein